MTPPTLFGLNEGEREGQPDLVATVLAVGIESGPATSP